MVSAQARNNRTGQQVQLYLLLVFSCIPMAGVLISFQNFNIFKGFFHSKWIGFGVFEEIFRTKGFWQAVRNTLMLNSLNLAVGFPAPYPSSSSPTTPE